MNMLTPPPQPITTCQAYPASAFYVMHGINYGDDLALPDQLCLGDSYRLEEESQPVRLALIAQPDGSYATQQGAVLHCAARYRMMAADGETCDLLILQLSDQTLWLHPMQALSPSKSYSLLEILPPPQPLCFNDRLCVSFARGTRITLGDGRQAAIETLSKGAKILTRDHGAQELQGLCKATYRASGEMAPVVVSAGHMGNLGDLVVSPHHRLFRYSRRGRRRTPTAEILVQARHLVDDRQIYRREGGYVDYYSLIFACHEIIYAEGIPAESLQVSETTLARLPEDLSQHVKAHFPALQHQTHFGTETDGRDALPADARPVDGPRGLR